MDAQSDPSYGYDQLMASQREKDQPEDYHPKYHYNSHCNEQPSASAPSYDDPPLYSTGQLQPPPGQVVVSAQPTQVIVVHPAPLVNPPSDGLVIAILITLFCCWPLGIFAIVRSVQCRDSIRRGDRVEAVDQSNSSRYASIAGFIIGTVIIIVSVVRIIVILQDTDDTTVYTP